MKLHSYFRSSASYRVRIAMNLKGITYDLALTNLINDEQHSERYQSLNPEGLIPCLETNEGILSQSLAIIEWLDERYPYPALLPDNAWQRALARSFAYVISCDIHPLNNLRVLKYLEKDLHHSDDDNIHWYQHWINTGFTALEKKVGQFDFCCTDNPGIADICLVPQVFNALRFEVSMSAYPKLQTIYQRCNELEAFQMAAPGNQPDAT